MTSFGLRHGPPEVLAALARGEAVDPSKYYCRTAPRFPTSGPPDAITAFSRGEVVDPARYYFRTVPRFETSAEAYAFLNRIVSIGVGETRPDGAVHRINEIL